MIKSVLLTRSEFANNELKKILEKPKYNLSEKYELLECSLIKYELQNIDLLELYKFQNIIVTSFFAANNLPELSNNNSDPSKNNIISAWVVGNKSAKILKQKGYEIQFIAQNAQELKSKILKTNLSNVIYPSSDKITVNMPSHITHKVFYKVFYKKSLSNEQILRYKQGIDYILLYSENCAKTFIKLLLDNNLIDYLKNTKYITISQKVAKIVEPYFENIRICKNSDLMLKYLETK